MLMAKRNSEIYKHLCLSQSHKIMSIKQINKQSKRQVQWLANEADWIPYCTQPRDEGFAAGKGDAIEEFCWETQRRTRLLAFCVQKTSVPFLWMGEKPQWTNGSNKTELLMQRVSAVPRVLSLSCCRTEILCVLSDTNSLKGASVTGKETEEQVPLTFHWSSQGWILLKGL